MGGNFKVKSGTGQGDPVSADNFNIATEPLNLVLQKHLETFAYVFSNGHKPGLQIYADDNLLMTNLRSREDLQIIIEAYEVQRLVA